MPLVEQPLQDAARFFEVLSDESRLRLLWLLMNHKELCACHLTTALGISQDRAFQHLKILEESGLVKNRAEAGWSYYAVLRANGDLSRGVLRALRASLSARSDAAALLWKVQESLSAQGRSCAPSRADQARAPRSATTLRKIAAGGPLPRIQVFDPPARCSTTLVCGRPTIDPVLTRFAADVRWLKSKGFHVE